MSSSAYAIGESRLATLHQFPAAKRLQVVLDLIRNSSGEGRQTALRVGAELVPEDSLLDLLREEADDVARNAGLEMLKLRGRRAFSAVTGLLDDHDDDVVMQAVQLVEAGGDPRGWTAIRRLLRHRNSNVVQAVIAAAGAVGNQGAALDLIPFLDQEPWLQFAAIDAMGRLRSRPAIAFIAPLLKDPLLSDLTADALVRIGGVVAVIALSEHFLAHESELDLERWLGLLAIALSDNDRPFSNEILRARIVPYLDSPSAASAAACVLALGPGTQDEDAKAIAVLAESATSAELPPCLLHRSDLLPFMLSAEPPVCSWGLRLAAHVQRAPSEEIVQRVLLQQQPDDPDLIQALARLIGSPRLLLELYAAFPPHLRTALHESMRAVSDSIAELLDNQPLDEATRVLLRELTGESASTIAEAVTSLDPAVRVGVVEQMQTAAVDLLPWRTWIRDDPALYLPLFADTASRFKSAPLSALLFELLPAHPIPVLIKAAGTIGDQSIVPQLMAVYGTAPPLNRAFALEAMGEIGGPEAVAFLRQITFGSSWIDVRPSARAFAHCAGKSDIVELEALTSHEEWAVRLAALDALGRIDARSPVIERLLADPVAVVAQKACSLLASVRSST